MFQLQSTEQRFEEARGPSRHEIECPLDVGLSLFFAPIAHLTSRYTIEHNRGDGEEGKIKFHSPNQGSLKERVARNTHGGGIFHSFY